MFPSLPLHPGGPPDWYLRQVESPILAGTPVLLGEQHVRDTLHIRLFKMDGGFRIEYSDTGIFDIPTSGRETLWCPSPEADEGAARLDALGYVFAMMVHAAGGLCLHGSAVSLGSGGVGFLAPKYHGKSTLARALTSVGTKLATDDSILLSGSESFMLHPGIHEVRLWSDSAAHFEDESGSTETGHDGKYVWTTIGEEHLMLDPVPLQCLYLLVPVRSEPGRAALSRIRLTPIRATMALIANAKGGPLLGGEESGRLLERIGDLTRAVPVYRLELVRGFDRLDEVVDQLLDWHGGP